MVNNVNMILKFLAKLNDKMKSKANFLWYTNMAYYYQTNFGGAKLWRIWQITFLSSNITLQIMHNDSRSARFAKV